MDGERINAPLERDAMHDAQALGTNELVLAHDYKAGFAYSAGFLRDVVARDLPHERFAHWHTTSWSSAALLDPEDEAGCVAMVSISAGGVSVHLAAHTNPRSWKASGSCVNGYRSASRPRIRRVPIRSM